MRFSRFIHFVGLFLVICFLAGCSSSQPAPKDIGLQPIKSETPKPTFSHAEFDALLKKYVVSGRVKYREWVDNAQDRAALAAYVKRLGEAKPDALPEADQKAFWINAYNALTVAAVLEKYPLKSVNYEALRDEKAKQFWEIPYPVAGGQYPLDYIENGILRPRYHDARIHFAINCASIGCPNLQPQAFEGRDLDAMLDKATTEYLKDETKGAKWDEAKETLTVSSIFQWYKEDFGDAAPFIARFRPETARAKSKVSYLNYDWNLNDVGSASTTSKKG